MTDRYPTAAVPDRPEFEIRVGGEALPPGVHTDVIEIDVSEEIDRHGRLSLLVQNWNADLGEVRHSDDGPFTPGEEIEVLLGYHSELASVFAGVITGLTAHFPTRKAPTLKVEARSKSVLLAQPERSRVAEDVTDEDVARTIASDYGLDADVAPGIAQDVAVQHRASDWAYLLERGRRLGWVTYVRGDSLVSRPAVAAGEVDVELTWGANLTEVHLTQDVGGRADPVVAAAWSPDDLAPIDSEADAASSEVETGDRPTHGAALEDAGWPLRSELAPSARELSVEEADRVVAGRIGRHTLRHVSGYGSTVGIPTLRIDSWLNIAGTGARLAGPHYVTAVRHRLGAAGFVTEFQVGLPAPLLPPPVAAEMAGLRLGVVEDLDDPRGWGRVKVAFPWRTDAPEPVWARLATLDAGPEQGTWFVPDVGQEVLVGVVADDERLPVVLGSLWNGQQAPPESMDPDANDIRAVVSRSGHAVRFDDGDAASVEVVTAAGHRIFLNDKDGVIDITEKGGQNGITISQDGIEITAGSGDIALTASAGNVKIDAIGIEGKATGPTKLESSATLDLKASATLGIQGALVNIN